MTTVVFADLVGSTSLYERLGDAAASGFVNELVGKLRQVFEKHQGRVVKLLGDGLFVVFAGEGDALAACMQIQKQLLDAPLLRFLGLSTLPAQTVDFEPVFPWLAAFLAGMGFGRIGQAMGLWDRLRGWPDGRATRLLSWPGQLSLAIYLIHQPVLLALVAAYAQLR